MNCPRCDADFIWGGDHDFEDYGYEGDGIVTNMSCPTKWCEASLLLLLPETTRLIDIIDRAEKKVSLSQTEEKSACERND